MQIVENPFDYLDAPIVKAAGANVSIPKSPVLERLVSPNVERICKAVKSILS